MTFQNTIEKLTKGQILPFPKIGSLGIIKNYKAITITAIATKVYNAQLLNRIRPEIEKIIRKNQNGIWRNRFTVTQIQIISRIIEVVRAKILRATPLIVDFSKTFDSIHRWKMEQILLAYGLPKETVTTKMIDCKKTKAMVGSPDGEWHWLLLGLEKGYISIISIYDLRRLCATNSNKSTERRHYVKGGKKPTICRRNYCRCIIRRWSRAAEPSRICIAWSKTAKIIGLNVNSGKNKVLIFYRRMQCAVLNQLWKQNSTKEQLQGYLQSISQTIQVRHARHCWRSEDKLISYVL